jgi:hypothetical protein
VSAPRPALCAASFAWQLPQVAAQQRVEDLPLTASVVLDDDAGIAQCSQGLVGDVGSESLVELGAERDPLGEPLCVSAERAQ